jgi:peptide/nickel transport system permease protein
VQGDLGDSIALRESVNAVITQRAAVTFELVLYASILILLLGIGSGVLAGLRRGALDTTVIAATTVSAAIPSFVAAIVLIAVFAVNLGWFPALGAGEGVLDRLWHLTLPAIALALSALAIVARVTRVSVRDEMGREHVQTAISRGLPWHLIVRRHVLRNAAIPITTISGITIASLIALSAVVERAFSLNGLGAALVSAAASKDFAVVQGVSLILVAAFVITNAIVDLLYAVLDPRVALGSRAE